MKLKKLDKYPLDHLRAFVKANFRYGWEIELSVQQGTLRRVPVECQQAMGNLVEVSGDLHEGQEIVLMNKSELRDGTHVVTALQSASVNPLQERQSHH